jgi:hypothetical protein
VDEARAREAGSKRMVVWRQAHRGRQQQQAGRQCPQERLLAY